MKAWHKAAILVLTLAIAGGAVRCRRQRFAAELMEPGYRAVAVPFPAWQTGHIWTGDRVDVLATVDSVVGGSKRPVTLTLLQNVRVLSVRRSGALRVLVLKLNPYETQYAALAPSQSELTVALRAKGDGDLHPMEIATLLQYFL